MANEEKMSAESRQTLIIDKLKNSDQPITGSEFARLANVSRQVVVQDVSILKAKKEPIIATSQGYIYVKQHTNQATNSRIVAVDHNPKQTQEELYLMVDHGVTVKNVIVEHAVYGDLTASIMVSNRAEVDQFIKKITDTNASYLSELTGGVHLHTLEADNQTKIDAACEALKNAGILLT